MTSSQPDARRAKALELHLAGATYDAIAQAVGYASRSGAHKAVQEALNALGRPAAGSEVADAAIARLDAMLTGLWPKARRGDVQAIDRVLRIEERRMLLEAERANVEGGAATKETGLSDFEKRLRERESSAKGARKAKGS